MSLGVGALAFAADQISKALVETNLRNGNTIELLGGLVRLDYTRNTGAAFSLLQTGGWLFAIVAVAVSAGILLYLRRAGDTSLGVVIALGLILGGALGNLADRIRLGYVVDFIDLRWWPVFNVADSAIVFGVASLIIRSLCQPAARQ